MIYACSKASQNDEHLQLIQSLEIQSNLPKYHHVSRQGYQIERQISAPPTYEQIINKANKQAA